MERHDSDLTLDQLLERASASMLESLNATIDVEQCRRDLYRKVGLDPELTQDERTPWNAGPR